MNYFNRFLKKTGVDKEKAHPDLISADGKTNGSATATPGSESPACSTPTNSNIGDTTTDEFESAEEGTPRKLSLTALAEQLDKVHLSTPQEPSEPKKPFVFPYSPVVDELLVEDGRETPLVFSDSLEKFEESPVKSDAQTPVCNGVKGSVSADTSKSAINVDDANHSYSEPKASANSSSSELDETVVSEPKATTHDESKDLQGEPVKLEEVVDHALPAEGLLAELSLDTEPGHVEAQPSEDLPPAIDVDCSEDITTSCYQVKDSPDSSANELEETVLSQPKATTLDVSKDLQGEPVKLEEVVGHATLPVEAPVAELSQNIEPGHVEAQSSEDLPTPIDVDCSAEVTASCDLVKDAPFNGLDEAVHSQPKATTLDPSKDLQGERVKPKESVDHANPAETPLAELSLDTEPSRVEVQPSEALLQPIDIDCSADVSCDQAENSGDSSADKFDETVVSQPEATAATGCLQEPSVPHDEPTILPTKTETKPAHEVISSIAHITPDLSKDSPAEKLDEVANHVNPPSCEPVIDPEPGHVEVQSLDLSQPSGQSAEDNENSTNVCAQTIEEICPDSNPPSLSNLCNLDTSTAESSATVSAPENVVIVDIPIESSVTTLEKDSEPLDSNTSQNLVSSTSAVQEPIDNIPHNTFVSPPNGCPVSAVTEVPEAAGTETENKTLPPVSESEPVSAYGIISEELEQKHQVAPLDLNKPVSTSTPVGVSEKSNVTIQDVSVEVASPVAVGGSVSDVLDTSQLSASDSEPPADGSPVNSSLRHAVPANATFSMDGSPLPHAAPANATSSMDGSPLPHSVPADVTFSLEETRDTPVVSETNSLAEPIKQPCGVPDSLPTIANGHVEPDRVSFALDQTITSSNTSAETKPSDSTLTPEDPASLPTVGTDHEDAVNKTSIMDQTVIVPMDEELSNNSQPTNETSLSTSSSSIPNTPAGLDDSVARKELDVNTQVIETPALDTTITACNTSAVLGQDGVGPLAPEPIKSQWPAPVLSAQSDFHDGPTMSNDDELNGVIDMDSSHVFNERLNRLMAEGDEAMAAPVPSIEVLPTSEQLAKSVKFEDCPPEVLEQYHISPKRPAPKKRFSMPARSSSNGLDSTFSGLDSTLNEMDSTVVNKTAVTGAKSRQSPMNTSYTIARDPACPRSSLMDFAETGPQMSQILATCSRQEHDLQSDAFSCIQEEAARFAEEFKNDQAEENSEASGGSNTNDDSAKDEFFQQGSDFDFDFLSQVGGKSKFATNLARKSLYVKFDPLVQKVLASSDDPESDLVLGFVAKNRTLAEETKSDVTLTNETQSDITSETPADDRLIPITPVRTKTTAARPVSQTPSLRQEITRLQEMMLQQEAAHQEKEDLVETLKRRITELETGRKEAPAAPSSAELAEKDKKIDALQREIQTAKNNNKQLVQVMEEYEKTISRLVAMKEETAADYERERAAIVAERDEALQHLANMEVAFNDVHQKYERAKVVIETFHSNELALKKNYDALMTTVKKQKEGYMKFKEHAAETLQAANEQIQLKEREIARMKVVVKKDELRCKSLQETISQKDKEIRELTQICDELIAKS